MKWEIKYENDTGPNDESFSEWWIITNGNKTFRTESNEEAKWLVDFLNRGVVLHPNNQEVGRYNMKPQHKMW
jgi:hypothetical protein